MNALGKHLLLELRDCNREVLDDLSFLQNTLVSTAQEAGATVVGKHFHRFAPQGVSGAVLIAESHLSLHTWPEYGYAAVDIFTCGENIDPWAIHDHLKEVFLSKNTSSMELKRGVFKMKGKLKHKVA